MSIQATTTKERSKEHCPLSSPPGLGIVQNSKSIGEKSHEYDRGSGKPSEGRERTAR